MSCGCFWQTSISTITNRPPSLSYQRCLELFQVIRTTNGNKKIDGWLNVGSGSVDDSIRHFRSGLQCRILKILIEATRRQVTYRLLSTITERTEIRRRFLKKHKMCMQKQVTYWSVGVMTRTAMTDTIMYKAQGDQYLHSSTTYTSAGK